MLLGQIVTQPGRVWELALSNGPCFNHVQTWLLEGSGANFRWGGFGGTTSRFTASEMSPREC